MRWRQLRCIVAEECAWNDEVATMRTVTAAVCSITSVVRVHARVSGLHPPRAALRFVGGCRRRHPGRAGRRRVDGRRGRRNDFSAPPGPLDRRAAASSADAKTLKTLAAVAKALEAEPAVRRNARSFAELGTEDVGAAQGHAGQAHVFVEVFGRGPTPGPSASSARRRPRSPRSRGRYSRGHGSWLAASVDEEELDGPEERIAVDPTDDDVRRCLALVLEAFAKHPSAEAWARQALIVQRGNAEYAAKKLTKLAAFRDRYGWAYRLDVDDRVAKALRSDMHWVLPGTDRRGRRVVVYNARALRDASKDLEALQKSLCLLLERITLDEETVRRGVVVVADCSGYLAVDAPEAVRRGRAARLGHGRRFPPPAHDLCGEPADAVVARSVVYPRVFIKEAEGPAPRERVRCVCRRLLSVWSSPPALAEVGI